MSPIKKENFKAERIQAEPDKCKAEILAALDAVAAMKSGDKRWLAQRRSRCHSVRVAHWVVFITFPIRQGVPAIGFGVRLQRI